LEVTALNLLYMVHKIVHPSEYAEFYHHMMYHRLVEPTKSWSMCVHCVDRWNRVFPALVKVRQSHVAGLQGLPKNFVSAGFLLSIEPLPDCTFTRQPVLPAPSQACVFESLRKVVAAGTGGLPKSDPVDEDQTEKEGLMPRPSKTSLRELMDQVNAAHEKGEKPDAALFTNLKGLIWSKAMWIARQRADVAEAVLGQSGPEVVLKGAVHAMLPKGHYKFVKAEDDRISRSERETEGEAAEGESRSASYNNIAEHSQSQTSEEPHHRCAAADSKHLSCPTNRNLYQVTMAPSHDEASAEEGSQLQRHDSEDSIHPSPAEDGTASVSNGDVPLSLQESVLQGHLNSDFESSIFLSMLDFNIDQVDF